MSSLPCSPRFEIPRIQQAISSLYKQIQTSILSLPSQSINLNSIPSIPRPPLLYSIRSESIPHRRTKRGTKMATVGVSLAEVHVMRKLYKQRLKEIEAQKKIKEIHSTDTKSFEFEEKEDSEFTASNGSSSGCFFWSRKKIHPNFNHKLGTSKHRFSTQKS